MPSHTALAISFHREKCGDDFSPQLQNGGRSDETAPRGHTRPADPGSRCSQTRHQAAVSVVAGQEHGGSVCRCSTKRAAPCGWLFDGDRPEFAVPPNGGPSSYFSDRRGWLCLVLELAAAAFAAPLVSAAARPLHVRVFQTFTLGVSPGWSHLRIRTSIQLRACRKLSLEAVEQQRTMHSMRAGEKRAFNARYSRDCSCVAQSSVPFMVSKCMCGPAKTRAICAKVSRIGFLCSVSLTSHGALIPSRKKPLSTK